MIKMKNRMILLTGIFLIMSLLASCAGLQNTQGKSAVNDAFAPFIQKTKDGKNEVEMPGGRKEYKYQDAARTITSKEITSFKCEFERPYLWQAPYSYYIFDLERKDDDALCKIQTIRRPQIIADLEFETPLSALDSLQTIVIRIFPNEASIERLLGSLLIEMHENWISGRRYIDTAAYYGTREHFFNTSAEVLKKQAA